MHSSDQGSEAGVSAHAPEDRLSPLIHIAAGELESQELLQTARRRKSGLNARKHFERVGFSRPPRPQKENMMASGHRYPQNPREPGGQREKGNVRRITRTLTLPLGARPL